MEPYPDLAAAEDLPPECPMRAIFDIRASHPVCSGNDRTDELGVEHVTTLLRHGSATGVTRHLATSLLDLLAVGAVYFVLAKIGLTLASINSSTSAIWPATGFALAAVVLWGCGGGARGAVAALAA